MLACWPLLSYINLTLAPRGSCGLSERRLSQLCAYVAVFQVGHAGASECRRESLARGVCVTLTLVRAACAHVFVELVEFVHALVFLSQYVCFGVGLHGSAPRISQVCTFKVQSKLRSAGCNARGRHLFCCGVFLGGVCTVLYGRVGLHSVT